MTKVRPSHELTPDHHSGGPSGRGAGRSDPAWAAVLFDLDGTLADTVPLILRSYRHTMQVHRGRELPDSEWLRTLGTPLREQLKDFARDDAEVDAMASTYGAFQHRHHDEMVAAFPGALEALVRLRAERTAVGVVTSKRSTMTARTLNHCGLAEHLDVVVTADDVQAAKPDPEPVLNALRRLGMERRVTEVLFVGDSPFDILAGRGAGVRTVAALWGPFERHVLERAGPDHYLRRLTDLPSIRRA